MREILFRGKSVATQRWVKGFFFKDENGKAYMGYMKKERFYPDTRDYQVVEFYENNPTYAWIFVKEEVAPETVGQYTGLNDKHGVQIFEGDIVLKRTYQGKKKFPVSYHDGMFHCGWGGGSSTATHGYTLADKQIEVVGNEYDNEEE